MPPKSLAIRADGWVPQNVIRYGNSVVPNTAIRTIKRYYGDKWKETLENILTYNVREKTGTADIVVLRKGTTAKNLWIAERRRE